MPVRHSQMRGTDTLARRNQVFYDALWTRAGLVEPQRFNTWPLVQRLASFAPRRLEVACGLRPRLPLEGSTFVDASAPALASLRCRGAAVVRASITALPFATACFDLVCALDVIEHVEDDASALAELARVSAPAGILLLSVPLYPERWTAFDDIVGHCRRYVPDELLAQLGECGFQVVQSAMFGMQPRASWLLEWSMRYLARHPRRAMWWYDRVFMPLGLRFQRPLALVDGVVADDRVDEVLLLCRRSVEPDR